MSGMTMKQESTNASTLHAGRASSYERVDRYHREFLDDATGRFDERHTAPRACPVCDADVPEKMFDKSGGTYTRCGECTMVYLNPAFTQEALNTYYRNLDTGQAEIVAREQAFYTEIYGLGLSVLSEVRPGGHILDIGCSAGAFLDLCRERGWTTYGIELGAIEAEMCRQKGHTLFSQDVRELGLGAKFDAVTMWDVFEHIPDGKSQLLSIARLLKPGGVVFLQIPNSGGLAPRIMHEACRMFDGVEHVNLYNPDTVVRVAAATGFEVVRIKTVISEIAVLNNFLTYRDPYFGGPGGDARLLGFLDAEALHANLLGYKIQAVLQLQG
jgi:2-polyprenyl-3-methyl-5-hydroxy-6-metoxy-1,4-benzoquinol methylase